MQNPNQPSQMPPNPQAQVPDHRMNEMMERLRTLELQNTQLRTTVDFLKQPQGGTQPQNQNPAFKPEVEAAIKQTVQGIIEPMQVAHRQQLGYLADQVDQARFQASYGGDKYAKYLPRVEQIRAQEQAQGRYIPREDALRMVHWEETGKKGLAPDPQAPQVPAPPAPPKFDPFFGTYVGADGKPIQPGQEIPQVAQPGQEWVDPAQDPAQQPQQQQWQQQPPAQWQQQQPQQQPQPQQWQTPPGVRQPMQTQHPNGNAYGQQFTLPNQGMNSAAAPAGGNGRQALSLESSDADLKAFENNFGDIPL